MLKKVFLAIECTDEKQRDELQSILNEISAMRVITAEQILKAWPMIKARQSEIRNLFALVAQNGAKGIMSMQGVSAITQLMRK